MSDHSANTGLLAGAAALDITPDKSLHLCGYPHVARNSTGTLDPLLVSALYLADGKGEALILANDLVFINKDTTAEVRGRIEAETGIAASAIQISCTHTHSGPITAYSAAITTKPDPAMAPDSAYMSYWKDRMVEAAKLAKASAVPAEAGLEIASAAGLGSNRHDPAGPADLDLPVLGVRGRDGGPWIACMTVCHIHPTVLHEDSTLYSGDFPGQARQILAASLLGASCPFVYHNGVSGNQSPRHVVRGTTVAEARRLGQILADAVTGALGKMTFRADLTVAVRQGFLEFTHRPLPTVDEATRALDESVRHLQHLRDTAAPHTEVRTAECDWFGAEKTLELAQRKASGELDGWLKRAQPAEISVVRLGPWNFVFWPGEWFVEYGLQLREKAPNTFAITCANGETQGYIVTGEAVKNKRYEATNATFCHTNGPRGVEKTLELLA